MFRKLRIPKFKTDRFYRDKDNPFESALREDARKASITYQFIANLLEKKVEPIRAVIQSREYIEPMSSHASRPLGKIRMPSKNIYDANTILSLDDLKMFKLFLSGGYSGGDSEGMRGSRWPNVELFLEHYVKKCNHSNPDYLTVEGKDPISRGRILIDVGHLPELKVDKRHEIRLK